MGLTSSSVPWGLGTGRGSPRPGLPARGTHQGPHRTQRDRLCLPCRLSGALVLHGAAMAPQTGPGPGAFSLSSLLSTCCVPDTAADPGTEQEPADTHGVRLTSGRPWASVATRHVQNASGVPGAVVHGGLLPSLALSLSLSLSLFLLVSVSDPVSVPLSPCLCPSLPVSAPVSVSVYLSLSPCLCLSLPLSLSLSLPHPPPPRQGALYPVCSLHASLPSLTTMG